MKRLFYICLFLFVFVWLGGFVVFAYHINHYDTIAEKEADAVVVLTGGKNRISHAFSLLNKGMGKKMFISGVPEDVSIESILKQNRVSFGKNKLVELGKASHTTLENAEETTEWMNNNFVKSIYLVTSNYHTPRSEEEFAHLNPRIEIFVSPVYSDNVAKKWWLSWGTFKLFFAEYHKFLYVYFSHAAENLKYKIKYGV